MPGGERPGREAVTAGRTHDETEVGARRRRIRHTWAVAVGVPLVLVLLIGAWTLVFTRSQRSDFERVSDDSAVELGTIAELQRELLEAEDPITGVLYEIDRTGSVEEQWQQWLAHRDAVDRYFEQLTPIIARAGQATILDDARGSWSTVVEGVDVARSMWGTGEVAAALTSGQDPFGATVWAPLKETELGLATLAVRSVDGLRDGSARAERAQSAAEALFVVALLVAVALAAGSAWLLSIRVIRPMESLQHAVARLRNGELDQPIVVSPRAGHEVGALAGALATMASGLRTSQNRLRTQAYTDGLTGLANRRAFSEALEQCAARGGEIAVVLVDVDDFKVVNDSMGHQAGDELLVRIGSVLRSSARDAEDLIARVGGDEFAVIVRAVDGIGAAERVAERILDRLGAELVVTGGSVRVGCSIGIAGGRDAATADEIVRRADTAMYDAKRRGKRRVAVFDPSAGPDGAGARAVVPDPPWREPAGTGRVEDDRMSASEVARTRR